MNKRVSRSCFYSKVLEIHCVIHVKRLYKTKLIEMERRLSLGSFLFECCENVYILKIFFTTNEISTANSAASIFPWIDEYLFFSPSLSQEVKYSLLEESSEKSNVADAGFEQAMSSLQSEDVNIDL